MMPLPNGGAPAPAPASAAPSPAPAGKPGLPPEIASLVNPNDPFTAQILDRLDKLTPQDMMALDRGITNEGAAVLKKLFPEIAKLIDALTNARGGGMAAPPAPGPRPMQAPPVPAMPGAPPKSGLNRF
jgi:hypothetical protein